MAVVTCTFEDGGKGNLRHAITHALVVKDGKILLVKRAKGLLEAGKWGFPGGYLSRDETAGEGAVRELMEETGYEAKVKELFRVNSNPKRRNDDARQNVALEILMEIGEKTGESDWEQTEVKWFSLDEVNLDEMAFDHADTIELLRKYYKTPFSIPIFV